MDLWSDVIEKAWTTVRLQSRNADKIATLTMEIRLLGTLPKKVFMDAGRARQVIQNLLLNAIKFTPEKGSVVMLVDLTEADLLRIRRAYHCHSAAGGAVVRWLFEVLDSCCCALKSFPPALLVAAAAVPVAGAPPHTAIEVSFRLLGAASLFVPCQQHNSHWSALRSRERFSLLSRSAVFRFACAAAFLLSLLSGCRTLA